jgi:hypothetical protein
VLQGGECGRRGSGEVAPPEVSASEDAVPPRMGCGIQALRCMAASTSRRARRSGWCLQPAKHGAVEGNDVHGGHGSDGHGVHHGYRRSSDLDLF